MLLVLVALSLSISANEILPMTSEEYLKEKEQVEQFIKTDELISQDVYLLVPWDSDKTMEDVDFSNLYRVYNFSAPLQDVFCDATSFYDIVDTQHYSWKIDSFETGCDIQIAKTDDGYKFEYGSDGVSNMTKYYPDMDFTQKGIRELISQSHPGYDVDSLMYILNYSLSERNIVVFTDNGVEYATNIYCIPDEEKTYKCGEIVKAQEYIDYLESKWVNRPRPSDNEIIGGPVEKAPFNPWVIAVPIVVVLCAGIISLIVIRKKHSKQLEQP